VGVDELMKSFSTLKVYLIYTCMFRRASIKCTVTTCHALH